MRRSVFNHRLTLITLSLLLYFVCWWKISGRVNNKAKNNQIMSTMSPKKKALKNATNSLVRLVVISDTHGHHRLFSEPLPSGDILIHCGDFANRGNVEDVRDFVKWFDAQTCCPYKIVIQGNHDRNRHDNNNNNKMNLKTEFEQVNNSTRLLLDETVAVAGVTIHGASWDSCETGNFTRVPRHNIDILLAHKHPYIADKMPGSLYKKKTLRAWKGSKALTKTVLKGRSSIPLCCSGHVHWGRGVVSSQRESKKGKKYKSVFVNAASLQSSSSSSNGPKVWPPVVIDYNRKDRVVVSVDCPFTEAKARSLNFS